MKHCFLILIAIGWALTLNAQSTEKPRWVTNMPSPSNDTFYYRVTIGEGMDYNKAYANSFAKAILESSWKLGVEVHNEADLKSIEEGVYNDITICKKMMKIPMNKVCEFIEPLQSKTGVRIYILWQIATAGNIIPTFDEYSNCE